MYNIESSQAKAKNFISRPQDKREQLLIVLFLHQNICCRYSNYSKPSKISKTFCSQIICWFSGLNFLVRIANRKDPDQTASSEAV